MLLEQLQQAYAQRFALKRDYVRVLRKFDPGQPRDEHGRWIAKLMKMRKDILPFALEGHPGAAEAIEELNRLLHEANPTHLHIQLMETLAKKFDPDQLRDPKGTSTGGQFTKTTGRSFTSEEGYQWHEQGPGAGWAKTLPYADVQAINGYSGFGYHGINDLRRGTFKPSTISHFVRAATPEEMRRVGWDVEKNVWVPSVKVNEDTYKPGYPVDPRDVVTPETINRFGHPVGRGDATGYDPEDTYRQVEDGRIIVNQYYRPVEGGPTMMFSIQRTGPDLERLAQVQKEADHLDDLIAHRGLVLNEPIEVMRGAYLPGVTFEQLQDMAYEGPNGEPPAVYEEKGFTSTFLGDAEGRAKNYPALGKWESLYNRYPNQPLAKHQDEVGTAVLFHITLPKGTKVAAVEPVRRLTHDFPKVVKPVPEHLKDDKWFKEHPETYTERDYTATPTVDASGLQRKEGRSESEILLGSGARFRVVKVHPGYTSHGSDDSLKPVRVREVYLEYIGGSSDGRA